MKSIEEYGNVVADVLGRLETRFPGLASWLRGRLDLQLPALVMSLTLHGVLLVGLALAGYRAVQDGQREFRSRLVDNRVSSDLMYQDLDQSAEPPAPMPAA